MALHHLIYLSTPTSDFSASRLKELLLECRTKNNQQDVTGILFYGGQHFMQLIEGEQSTIYALYERLQNDPRHQNLLKLADKPILARAFSDWSMAFKSVDASLAGPGVLDLESAVLNTSALPDADKQLLETVRQQLLTA
ncbi:BLUF domain-containing protein [Hymenobacter rigui]|uniref:BLUF domain-containing protein n=1 Tax=Hymenobacter rigui TaxID=334424 RepID=A0A428KU12_9BACT|nr:BLUF domain-containing protein [Hymenobacter rigui]RSK50062.1 BLUF domain-containing protein [Hymenobacter rigui]